MFERVEKIAFSARFGRGERSVVVGAQQVERFTASLEKGNDMLGEELGKALRGVVAVDVETVRAIKRVAALTVVAVGGEGAACLLKISDNMSRSGGFGGRPRIERAQNVENRSGREAAVVPNVDGAVVELEPATLTERLGSTRPIIKKSVI